MISNSDAYDSSGFGRATLVVDYLLKARHRTRGMERRPYFQSPCKIRAKKFLTTPLMRRSLAYRAMLKRGWSEVGESDDWDIFWSASKQILAALEL